jgi:16S rRNA (guanine(966)-N(2))-methyltransferase RsmD
MDRMRESVYAVIGDLEGMSFLDLFSGSGIIALEAASRGASHIEAVEADPLKRKTLLENISISPVKINCRFMSAELYIKRAKQQFDFIFCDPPFTYKYRAELLELIGASKLVKEGSNLLLHAPKEEYPVTLPRNMVLTNRRDYGRSIVYFCAII